MTWNYVDPLSSTRDEVRLLLGDIDNLADATLSDEEIAYFLAMNQTIRAAAVAGAMALAARWGALADMKTVDGMTLQRTTAENYRKLAAALAAGTAGGTTSDGGGGGPRVFVGGKSVSAKDAQRDDPDAVQPYFRRGMQEAQDPDPLGGSPGS